MATRIDKVQLKNDGTLKVKYKQNEVPRNGEMEFVKAKYQKESEQLAHKDLINAFLRLTPHLMFHTGFADHTVAIPTKIEDKAFFDDLHFLEDERFKNVRVTEVQTFGKDAIEGVGLSGFKENEAGYRCKFKTDCIYLDRADPEHYQLLTILDSQIDTLMFEVDEYISGKTIPKSQLELELPK